MKRLLRALCWLGIHARQKTGRFEAPMPTGPGATFEQVKAWLGPVVWVRGCRDCGKVLERTEDWNA